MPREVVRIDVSSNFRIEPAARFFATLAFPDAVDRHDREQFWLALCRWYIAKRVNDDAEFGRTPYDIVPAIFTATQQETVRILRRGIKNLHHRITATNWIVMPHLRGRGLMPHLRGVGLKPIQIEKNGQLESVIPTVNNMSVLAMEELGWRGKGKSVSTLKSKIWAPSRAVVHAAAAYLRYYWCEDGRMVRPNQIIGSPLFFLLLEHPFVVAKIIKASETIRLMLPSIEQFEIKEEDTIQFLAEGTPLELAESNQEHQVEI
jgi:hypothetical protein